MSSAYDLRKPWSDFLRLIQVITETYLLKNEITD